jgi:hypothetical protein
VQPSGADVSGKPLPLPRDDVPGQLKSPSAKSLLSFAVFCPGRRHGAGLEAVPDRRFIPDRVRRAPIEFGAQIAAGVAHDPVVVAKG